MEHNPGMVTTTKPTLSRRAQEVAELIADGLTNHEIAIRLFLSERTVEGHVARIMDRLGVHSRSQIAAWVVARRVPSNWSQPPGGLLSRRIASFIDRQSEVRNILELISSARVITIVGPAGVGKTRLAIEGAAVAEARFSAGAWMVDLSPVSDPDLVPSVIRSQLGIQEKLGRSTLDQIADHLHSQPALLLLDNCEHVIAKSSEVIEYLTAVCPRLKVIATSREAMHIDGETVLHLRPLGPGDAFRLFEERAVAADSNFAIDVEDRRHVADICASVDGLPLAIELAAARIAAVPLEEMKHLLSNQLTLLQVPRGRPERHQSLQAAIAWSYGLLDESHQVVFSRLGVFRGFALRDAARLCAASDSDADKTPAIILDLVSKSLVQLNGERYRLLETLHNFALDRLDADRQLAPMQSRHAHYFLDVAESRQPAKLATWLDTMDAEQDNLRAAIGWALRDDIELAARLVLGLDVWWRMRARLDEARAYIDAILLKRDTQDGIQAKLLMNSGWYSSWLVSGQPELTTKPMDAALDLSRQLRSSAGLIDALLVRGRFSLDTGEASDSRVMFEEALNLSRSIGDRNRESDAVHLLAAADGAQLSPRVRASA
jgi:predicted ATPase/DNA-binding CsgD family transcriptional regulator